MEVMSTSIGHFPNLGKYQLRVSEAIAKSPKLWHYRVMSENPDTDLIDRLQFTKADRLSKSLAASGVSSQEMATALGVSRNTVSNWVNGRTEPQRRTDLITWSLRTGVPIEWIETGELKNPPRPSGPGGSDGECATRDSNPQPSDPKDRVAAHKPNLRDSNVSPIRHRPHPFTPVTPLRKEAS